MSNVIPFRRPAPAQPSHTPNHRTLADLTLDDVKNYVQLMASEHRHDELYAFLFHLCSDRPLHQPGAYRYIEFGQQQIKEA